MSCSEAEKLKRRGEAPREGTDLLVESLLAEGGFADPDVHGLEALLGDHPSAVAHELRGLLVVLLEVREGRVHEEPFDLVAVEVEVRGDGGLVVGVHHDELLVRVALPEVVLKLVLRSNDHVGLRHLELLVLQQGAQRSALQVRKFGGVAGKGGAKGSYVTIK